MSDLPPGRELDALVAEKVMGEPVEREVRVMWECGSETGEMGLARTRRATGRWMNRDDMYDPVPAYSTSISAAWEVVEKINRSHGPFHLRDVCHEWGDDAPVKWRAWFEVTEYPTDADTAPHAICLAALKAMEKDKW